MRTMRAVVFTFLLCSTVAAQPSEKLQQTLKRIFASTDFAFGDDGGRRGPRSVTAPRWLEDGVAYTTIETGEIVRYDAATGKREILMSKAQLTPPQTGRALAIHDYAWPADGKKLLAMTN